MFEKHIPKSEILKKYIDGIYIVKEFQEPKSFFAFPYLGNVFCLFHKTSIDFNKSSINFKSSNENPKIVLFGNYTNPIYVKYKEPVSEIFINFKLGGINNFFKKQLSELAPNTFQFVIDNQFEELIQRLYTINEIKEKIEAIEIFLLNRFEQKKVGNIEKCIELLLNNPNTKITHLANKFNVSTKTINRWFHSYTGFSPSDIKRIIKFRNAIQTKNNFPNKNLTSICYDNEFYDSSSFSKEFKKLTSLNPKDFFKSIDKELLKNQNLPFKFNF